MIKRIIILSCLLTALLLPCFSRAAFSFNPHQIISDDEMTDYTSLTKQEIQNFLVEQNSGLANLRLTDYTGAVKTAAEIIWQASIESQISPKMLLVTLQKEQSLVTDSAPSSHQLQRAMGYRCPDSGGCNASTLDFGKQVDGAAWQFRQYYLKPDAWTFRIGQTYDIDGYFVVPANQATAGLYNYTPHYSGNESFWRIWQKFWGVNYPDGSLVKAADQPGVWLIKDGAKRLISSYGVLLSRFDPKKIMSISRSDLEKYELGPAIKFYNYSLLRAPSGKIFLLVDDDLRWITTPEVFTTIGFDWEEVIEVSEKDLAGYGLGKDITVSSIYPNGALLQNKVTGGVYYAKDGIKQPIISRELMTANFKGKVLTQVSAEELDKYLTGEPVRFKDGELIKADNDSKIYVIADGYRHWIKSEKIFVKFGYKWDNIITTSQKAVDLHALGDDLE